MLAFGLAGASIMGLPPSGGFVAKWTLLEAALSAQQWQWIGVLLLGGLLAAAYVFRVLQLAFEPRNEAATSVAPLPRAMEWAPLALAMGAIALGFAAPPIFDILRIELSSPAVFVSAVAP
jgi:formate hydrogenlyase subunit 3/multisubunit Na+/H+ antiporter MnhD subunit